MRVYACALSTLCAYISASLCLAVIAGVNSAAVRRLKWTKERQSKAQIGSYEELQATMSSDQNYSAQREVIKTSDPPLLPYLYV
jgi:RasGEF domain